MIWWRKIYVLCLTLRGFEGIVWELEDSLFGCWGNFNCTRLENLCVFIHFLISKTLKVLMLNTQVPIFILSKCFSFPHGSFSKILYYNTYMFLYPYIHMHKSWEFVGVKWVGRIFAIKSLFWIEKKIVKFVHCKCLNQSFFRICGVRCIRIFLKENRQL